MTELLSSARATGPRPSGATPKLRRSSGESADTKVSMACTRAGRSPSGRGGGARALQADLLADAPDEDDRVPEPGPVEVSRRQHERRRADAVVERAAGGARRRAGARSAWGSSPCGRRRMPSASVPARSAVPTSTRTIGIGTRGRRAQQPSRAGRTRRGPSPLPVCTSAGWPSQSVGKKPPAASASSVPSSRIAFTVKPISSRWATKTTVGSPLPMVSQRLPAVSVWVRAQAGRQSLHGLPHRRLHPRDAVGLDQRRRAPSPPRARGGAWAARQPGNRARAASHSHADLIVAPPIQRASAVRSESAPVERGRLDRRRGVAHAEGPARHRARAPASGPRRGVRHPRDERPPDPAPPSTMHRLGERPARVRERARARGRTGPARPRTRSPRSRPRGTMPCSAIARRAASTSAAQAARRPATGAASRSVP